VRKRAHKLLVTPWVAHLYSVSQLLGCDKDREEWFSLAENHVDSGCFAHHPL
jgi:hypothetical protein